MYWVALSFVQKPDDSLEARSLLGDRTGLVAKIEKPAALDRIADIILLSDAVMVARGALGVEIPHEEVPGRQNAMVRSCRMAVKQVIVATPPLDSMVNAPTPTRTQAPNLATPLYASAAAATVQSRREDRMCNNSN